MLQKMAINPTGEIKSTVTTTDTQNSLLGVKSGCFSELDSCMNRYS